METSATISSFSRDSVAGFGELVHGCLRLAPTGRPEQISVIVASFVYEAAMQEQMLPRKPIEKPLPKESEKKEDQ